MFDRFKSIYVTMRSELVGGNFWRYHKCVSPGIQEFIEALSFLHYLDTRTLVTFEEAQRTLSDEQGVPVRAREPRLHYLFEYLGQCFDLPLLVYLTSLASSCGMQYLAFLDAVDDLKQQKFAPLLGTARLASVVLPIAMSESNIMSTDLERFTPYVRELSRKQQTTAQSLEKIEDGVS